MHCSLNCLSYSVIQSFEVVISLYAQQLLLNERQNFILPSFTLVAELVSTQHSTQAIFLHTTLLLVNDINSLSSLQRSVESLSQDGRRFVIGNTNTRYIYSYSY